MADILANSIPSMAAFMPDVEPNSVAPRWKRWSESFENLIVAMNVTDHARKKALLLHLAGEGIFEIFEGLVLDDIPDDADAAVTNVYTVAKKALDDHFNPKKILNLNDSTSDRPSNSLSRILIHTTFVCVRWQNTVNLPMSTRR